MNLGASKRWRQAILHTNRARLIACILDSSFFRVLSLGCHLIIFKVLSMSLAPAVESFRTISFLSLSSDQLTLSSMDVESRLQYFFFNPNMHR